MAFTSDITLNNGETDNVYSETLRYRSKSVRSDANQAVTEPNTFTISHEVAGNGRVSTVVYRDNVRTVETGSNSCSVATVSDTVRSQFKFAYNPTIGRSTIEAELRAQIAELIAFLEGTGHVDKLLNKEV